MHMHMTRSRAETSEAGAGLPIICSSRIRRHVYRRVDERVKHGLVDMSRLPPLPTVATPSPSDACTMAVRLHEKGVGIR